MKKLFLLSLLLLFFSTAFVKGFNNTQTPQKQIIKAEKEQPTPKIIITYPEPPSTFNYKLKRYIMKICNEEDVPYLLVFQLIKTESNWKAKSVNYNKDEKGKIWSSDHGIMQINSMNFEKFVKMYKDVDRRESSYDIKNNSFDNCLVGIRHLRDLYDQFGDWKLAVQAYNCGAKSVNAGRIPEKTRAYADRIVPYPEWWTFPEQVVVVKTNSMSDIQKN